MKKCPQCNSVYGDDVAFCVNDGAVLVKENLPLPSEIDDETDTIIRRDPIVVNFGETNAPTESFESADYIPQVQPVVIEQKIGRKAVSRNYAIFLVLGLLIGGVLVLATLFAARYVYRPKSAEANVRTANRGDPEDEKVQNINADRNKETKESGNEVDTLADALHQKRVADKPDEDFNGRVIAENAYVRSAPSREASEVDILPVEDRLTIERRENPNSPWYYVVCEHGVSGWMHGNTIEFTR